jgi:hypothetical protein
MDNTFKGLGLTSNFNVDEYRLRLEKMNDTELRKEGRTLAELTRPHPSPHTQPNEQWVVQLEECRAQWRKRHPRP